jgi:hypothetical protein
MERHNKVPVSRFRSETLEVSRGREANKHKNASSCWIRPSSAE